MTMRISEIQSYP